MALNPLRKETTRVAFATVGFCLSLGGLVLNILGCLALISTKSHGRKQTYLLINISIISSCFCLLFIPLWIFEVFLTHHRVEEVIFIFQCGFYMAYATTTIGFTFDRFFSIAMPLKHRVFITKKLVKTFIIVCWSSSLLSRIPFLLITSIKLAWMVYFDVAIDAINLLFQPVTYIYILMKWRSRSKKRNRHARTASPATLTRTTAQVADAAKEFRLLKIALFVTFSCMVASSSNTMYVATGMSIPSSNKSLLSPIAMLLWNVVPAAQPLIYIIIKPEIRQYFKTRFCSCIIE